MGGTEAPDHLAEGYRTQVSLALKDDPGARVTGEYFCIKSAWPRLRARVIAA